MVSGSLQVCASVDYMLADFFYSWIISRMGRPMFDRLVSILQEDPIFQSTGSKPQRHVKWQLACFLLWFGSLGSPTLCTAAVLSLGHGTVYQYCKRVTRALRKLSSRFVCWPDDARRSVISDAFEEIWGASDCIGCGDGSLIRLEEVPSRGSQQYWCRKKYPAVCIRHHSSLLCTHAWQGWLHFNLNIRWMSKQLSTMKLVSHHLTLDFLVQCRM